MKNISQGIIVGVFIVLLKYCLTFKSKAYTTIICFNTISLLCIGVDSTILSKNLKTVGVLTNLINILQTYFSW